MIRTRTPTFIQVHGAAALLSVATGCYQAQPLDARALLNELRAADRTEPGAGATAVPPKALGTLTEERSVAVALVWNRGMRAFRHQHGVAEGEVIAAGALENPQLRTELTHLQNLRYSSSNCPANAAGADCSLGWDLRLSWMPPQPGVRGGKIGAARARMEDVDRQINEREWALACDVRVAHAELLAVDEQIRIAKDTIANRKRLSDVVGRRVERGGTTRFDLDLVRLSLASSERAESERQLSRTVAANALVQLLGVGSPDGQVATGGTLADDDGQERPSQVELEDRALTNRPAVAATRARYRATEETLRAETALRWPWFRLSAIPRLRRNEFFGAVSDLVVGVDLILPILNTNRGPIQSAKAAREGARADVVAELAAVRTDIAKALAAIDAQRGILRRLRAETAPILAEHDRLLALAAQAAEFDLSSMIASENLVLESRIELIEARLQLRKAWIALERAVGAPVVATAPVGASPAPPAPAPEPPPAAPAPAATPTAPVPAAPLAKQR